MLSTPAAKSALIVVACLCGLAVHNILLDEKLVVTTKEEPKRSLSTTTVINISQLQQPQQDEQQQQQHVHVIQSTTSTPNTTATSQQHDPILVLGGGSNGTTTTKIDASHPLFVLALPNHLELALPRYFECGNITLANKKLGRHWSTFRAAPGKRQRRQAIGQYMLGNLKKQRQTFFFKGCCSQNQVFMDLQYLMAPQYLEGKQTTQGECFDPVLYPGALEALAKTFPKDGATILNVVRDPHQWLQSLSPNYPKMWMEWCNPTHNHSFPTPEWNIVVNPTSKLRFYNAMIQFYEDYQQKLRSFAKTHPHWKYIEINMDASTAMGNGDEDNNNNTIASQLEQHLGINAQCWMDSTRGNIRHLTPPDPNIPSIIHNQTRPNNVGWPILVTSLPKAGTSTVHDYFRCGMGDWTSAHQWTILTEPDDKNKHKLVTIGECLLDNHDHNDLLNATMAAYGRKITSPLPFRSFLEGCGNQLVWTDTGVLRQGSGKSKRMCYFPFLHRNGLERFYQSYPYGTLLNVVRNTTSWVDSAFRWRKLPDRWIKAKCEGMPTTSGSGSVKQEIWGDWYDEVQNTIRQFAMDHPTMTYIEIPLNHKAGDILYDIFGYPKQCWGHANVNTQQKSI